MKKHFTDDPDLLLKEVLDILVSEEDRKRNDSLTKLNIKDAIWITRLLIDHYSLKREASLDESLSRGSSFKRKALREGAESHASNDLST